MAIRTRRKNMRKLEIYGKIDDAGRLKLLRGELDQFLGLNCGKSVVVSVKVFDSAPSEAMKGYYYNYVVPTFQRAMWEAGERLNEKSAEERLRHFSPVTKEYSPEEDTGEYTANLRKITDLSQREMAAYLEHLKQIGAEEYSIYIEDPR